MRASRIGIDLAFGAAFILLGIAALLAFRSISQLRSSQSMVTRAERVLREIATVHADVFAAEAAHRGYLLTGQEQFLAPYRAARVSLEDGLLQLESLVAGDPDQSRNVARLRQLARRRLAMMQRAVRLADQGQAELALEAVRSGTGPLLMDSISHLARAMAQREFGQLEERRTTESATAGGTILFVLTGAVGAILIIATSRQSLLRELERRERAEESLAESSRYLRELYHIGASQQLDIQEKLDALVALGAARFDMPLGVLVHHRAEGNEIVAVYDPSGTLSRQLVLPPDVPCTMPVSDGNGSVLTDLPAGVVATHIAGIEVKTCLRTPLHLRGERGLLAFIDSREHRSELSDGHQDFLRLVAQWITSEVDRFLANEEIRRREERYRGLVESASDLIFTIDQAGNFTYVNPIAAASVGHPQDELIGRSAFELVRADYRDDVRAQLRTQVETMLPQAYYEAPVVTPDGREVWLGHNVQLLVEDGVVIGLQSVARDITRQREMERMKDEFLSVVSHELRTPLTAIRGSLGLVASGRMGELAPQGQRMLEIAAQNTDRLVRLINDLLDIDKIESGKAPLQKRPTDVHALVLEAVDSMRPLGEREGVTLVVEVQPLTATVDPDRMLQVLANLLSNAIKFSASGGTVRVTAGRRANHAVISVSDEGRGIPADKLQTIFERFQQVDSSDSRRGGGTGLGLAIVRQIAEQHGGTVDVQSAWGVGSTFTVAVPLPARELDATRAPLDSDRSPADAERGTDPDATPSADVLIVEDDVDLARVIAEMLRARGISSRIAKDGGDALAMARELDFDLLLLDPGLPGINGFEVTEQLRREPRHRDAAVLVYTTRELTAEQRDALRLGPTEFLTKSRHALNVLEARILSLLAALAGTRSGG